MIDFRRLRTDLLALGLLAVAVFVGLSLFSYNPADPPARTFYPLQAEVTNMGGTLGALIAHHTRYFFGLGAYFFLLVLVMHDIRLFSHGRLSDQLVRLGGGLLSLTAVCIGLQVLLPGMGDGPVVGSGGYMGASASVLLEQHFSVGGILILVFAAFFAGTLLSGELFLFRLPFTVVYTPVRLVNRFVFSKSRFRIAKASKIVETREHIEADGIGLEADDDEIDTLESSQIRVNSPVGMGVNEAETISRLETASSRRAEADFELPNLELLEEPEAFPYELLAKKARASAVTLERAFQEFGLNVRVVEIDTGPVITQFELELDSGLRLSKITALADDLAIALRVPSVRVVPSIPGKNTVGVEVPNDKQVMVRLRELIESCPNETDSMKIPIFLGKDVSGHPLAVDLAKMPHLLIAGRTGTGKSVCLNALILSILMTRSPDDVKMLMIDPKMVELSPYKRVPHLMHPVITDMKKAEAVLAWAVDKMEERYDLLARCGVRQLDGYNKLGREQVLKRCGIDAGSEEADSIPEKMPYIVIVADEMADMMMTSGKDVEGHIIRLAQKSRAVGIHLVLATQKPTVDVITGLIKSNLPARISFQVASRTDSRVVLDESGSERLLGNGDMLYLTPGTSHLTRAQGAFVSDDEVNNIIDFYGDMEPEYNSELAQISAASASTGTANADSLRNRDELYEQAIEVVIREGRGSVSLLQRALGIGYGRGARLIDYMAEDGIVGDYNGSQAREVLYNSEQWQAVKEGRELADLAV